MTGDERDALQTIRGYASAGRYSYQPHAIARMRQRNIRDADVRSALSNATLCVDQSRDPTTTADWKVTGPDIDGDALSCAVCIANGVIVITVF